MEFLCEGLAKGLFLCLGGAEAFLGVLWVCSS